MLFHTVKQGVACANIEDEIQTERITVLNREDEISSLAAKIETQEWLLQSRLRQADETGDHESFGPDIRQLEGEIRNLERQLDNARNKKQEADTDLRDAIAKWQRNDCDNPVDPSQVA